MGYTVAFHEYRDFLDQKQLQQPFEVFTNHMYKVRVVQEDDG